MAGIDELRARLSTLRDRRARGIRGYEIGDRSITFRSDAEMAAAIADLERQVREAESGVRVTQVRVSSSKGV